MTVSDAFERRWEGHNEYKDTKGMISTFITT